MKPLRNERCPKIDNHQYRALTLVLQGAVRAYHRRPALRTHYKYSCTFPCSSKYVPATDNPLAQTPRTTRTGSTKRKRRHHVDPALHASTRSTPAPHLYHLPASYLPLLVASLEKRLVHSPVPQLAAVVSNIEHLGWKPWRRGGYDRWGEVGRGGVLTITHIIATDH